jgi:hypothetical protein
VHRRSVGYPKDSVLEIELVGRATATERVLSGSPAADPDRTAAVGRNRDARVGILTPGEMHLKPRAAFVIINNAPWRRSLQTARDRDRSRGLYPRFPAGDQIPPPRGGGLPWTAEMISLVDLSAGNPLRPVDWRHQAAAELVAAGKPFPRRTWDNETFEVAAYLRRAGRGTDPRRLAAEFPALHMAFGIYQHPDPQLRYALEAQLMTADEAPVVAAWLGTSADVIEAYQAAFFDVRERLANVDFIIQRVVNPKANEPYEYRDGGWKLLAYVGGAEALSPLSDPDRAGGFDGALRAHRNATMVALGDRMRWLAERGSELDPRLMRDWPRIIGCITNKKAKNSKPSNPERNIEQFFESLPLEIVEVEEADRKDHPELPPKVELRPKGQRPLAAGSPVANVEELNDLEFSPPKHDGHDPAAAAAD